MSAPIGARVLAALTMTVAASLSACGQATVVATGPTPSPTPTWAAPTATESTQPPAATSAPAPAKSPGSRLSVRRVTIAMDYGQFVVSGAAEAEADGGVGLTDQALASSQQVADNGRSMLVLSPHQNNFSMVVTVERWDGPPPDDISRWEEGVEGGLVVESGLTLSSPTMDYVSVPMPAGDYVMRVVGRGFVARGWPGSTEPGDTWRIQLWPHVGTDPVPLRRLATWKG